MRKKGRSTVVLALAALLVLSFAGIATAAQPSDIQGHWAQEVVSDWVEQGLIAGYPDGTFKPDNSITRAEFITLVNRSFGYTATAELSYADVAAGDWFYQEVAKAKAAGYIAGYEDNTMRPHNLITRQEVAVIMTRLLELEPADASVLQRFADAGDIGNWAEAAVAAVVNNGLMQGYPDQTFKPAEPIKRAEAVVSLQRLLDQRSIPKASGIEGVITEDGKPVAGATVLVYAEDSMEALAETQSGIDGRYSFELPPGIYELTFAKDNSLSYQSDVSVKSQVYTVVNTELQPGIVVKGRLVTSNGKGVAGAELFFTTNPVFRTVTNDRGYYSIVLLPKRTYTVWYSDPGDQKDDPVILQEDLDIDEDKTTITLPDFTVPSPASPGGGGGGGGGAVDTKKPTVLAATVDVEGEIRYAAVDEDGVTGSIDMSDVPDAIQLNTGTITVSEDATLSLSIQVPGLDEYSPIAIIQELKKGSNDLNLFSHFDPVGEDGISLKTLRYYFGSKVIFTGTLTDARGNVSNLTFTVTLQEQM